MNKHYNITQVFISYRISHITKESLCSHFICINNDTLEYKVFNLDYRMNMIENFIHSRTYKWWINDVFLPRLKETKNILEYINQEVEQQSNVVQLHISNSVAYDTNKTFFATVLELFNNQVNTF